jgi:hypothetical protein
MHPDPSGEQTSFGSDLGPTFEAGSDGDSFQDFGSEAGNTGAHRTSGASGKSRGKGAGIPAMLADGLQAGADALRQRRASTSSGSSVTALVNDPAIAAVSDTLATGMQSGADWLRDADLDKLKDGVEQQVKEHPARTLLVALGAGYLLGKIFRR